MAGKKEEPEAPLAAEFVLPPDSAGVGADLSVAVDASVVMMISPVTGKAQPCAASAVDYLSGYGWKKA